MSTHAPGGARVHLERLGDVLQRRGWQVNLLGSDQRPELTVTNPDAPALCEVVRCRKDPAGWRFAWSWSEAIGPVDRVSQVADRIGYVLRETPGGATRAAGPAEATE